MDIDQQPGGDSQHEQQAEVACGSGHSAGAHHFSNTGKCSFCTCQEFAMEVAAEPNALITGLASDADYILLRDMAEQLGVAARMLRRAAAKNVVPATKVAHRWAIRGRDVKTVAEYFLARETARQREAVGAHVVPAQDAARRAQSHASRDMAAQRAHHGRLVSDRVLDEGVLASPARRAESEAIDHQLNPEATNHPGALVRANNGSEQAQHAEQAALEDILRPSRAEAPQRSL